MKKTAVEWLEKEFVKLEQSIGINSKMYELIEQAREMERKQIIDAHGSKQYHKSINGEQYYNETFNK